MKKYIKNPGEEVSSYFLFSIHVGLSVLGVESLYQSRETL